jgi:hypothetical protein
MELEMVNYSKNYFTKDEHDFSNVFDTIKIDEDSEIQKTKRELEKLRGDVIKKEEELQTKISDFKKTRYIPIEEKILLKYDGKGYATFDLLSGMPYYQDGEKTVEYSVYQKRGVIEVIIGYNFELGGIILKRYSYSINRNCDMLKIKPLAEIFMSFFEDKRVEYNFETSTVEEKDSRRDYYHYGCNDIMQCHDKGFINGFYGINYEGDYSLGSLIRQYAYNKSFEIILKTAPKEIMDKLLDKTVESAMPIHKILGVLKETYDSAIERGLILDLYNCIEYIDMTNKNEREFLDFLEYVKSQEDELGFYHISFGGSYYYDDKDVGKGVLAKTIISIYANNEVFNKNYSLGKFADYVIREVNNQGYESVRAFTQDLKDYLDMCELDNIIPTLYSSYLQQTHNIAKRNHEIKVEEESEKIFESRYDGFRKVKADDYMIVAPKNSGDVKQEGDRLNHCVASYIKKIIDGKCLIYFLRKKEDESLITFEVVDGKIVQARGMHNRTPEKDEYEALKKFAIKKELEVRI